VVAGAVAGVVVVPFTASALISVVAGGAAGTVVVMVQGQLVMVMV